MTFKSTRFFGLTMGFLALVCLAFPPSPAMAACNWSQADHPYDYECWGNWIANYWTDVHVDLYDQQRGDPFTIGLTDGQQSLFGITGTHTPDPDMPVSGTASYSGHMWGRGSIEDNDSHRGLLYPVTGSVSANVNFDAELSDTTRGVQLSIGFTDIRVHPRTNGTTPVSLPSQWFNGSIGHNDNSFSFDKDPGTIARPAKERYHWNFRRMYRDAAISGHFYGSNAEGIGGKFYLVEAEWKKNKAEVTANPDGFGGCSSNCAPVFWKVDAAWGAKQ